MIRLPDPQTPLPDGKGNLVEDMRQLTMWREQIARMFQTGGSVTGTPGLIAGGAIGTLSVTVTGCFADKAQTVEVGPSSTVEAGLVWSAFVSANDTVTIRIHNTTGGNITPASAVWTVRVTP